MAWSSLTIICCQHGHFYIICIGLCLLYIFGNWLCLLYIFCICVVVFCKSFVWALFCLYLLGIFILATFCKCHLSMWSNISWMMFCTTRYWSIVSWGFTDWGMSTGSTLQVGCLIDDIYDNSINKLVTLWRGASRWDHICDRWASLGRFLSK